MRLRNTSFIAIFLVLIIAGAVSAQSALQIKEPIFDFGYVPQQTTVSHIFWLYSTGNDPLKIIEVQPGCGCTKAPLEKDVVPVGDSTQLEILFSSRFYEGPLTKRPSIETDEGKIKKYLQFSADIYKDPSKTKPIVLNPNIFDLSRIAGKDRSKLQFEITNVSDQDLKLEVIDYPEAMLKIDFPDKIKAGKTETGKVEVKDFFKNIEFEKSITIELNDKDHTRFTIPVKRAIVIPGKASSTL